MEKCFPALSARKVIQLWTMKELLMQTSSQSHRSINMGSISVACYQPKLGQESALLELVRNHLTPLRSAGLVTDRDAIIMQCADGTIVEIFEWDSPEKIASAHTNPVVQELWKKFEATCSYKAPADIAEFQNMFSHFKSI